MVWRSVPFGGFLTRSHNWIEPQPDQIYKQVTARLWGRGLRLRGKVYGSKIAARRQVQVRENQFLLSRIDARHGAFGLVPTELDGALVSGDFPAFNVDSSQTHPRYLEWYSKTSGFVDLCRRASEGSTNRVRLKEGKFLAMKMPLPPCEEQPHIVARLDRVATLIEEATKLREEVERDVAALTQSLHATLCSDETRPLGDFVYLWEDRQAIQPDVLYPQVGIKGFAGGLFKKAAVKGSETSYRSFNRLHDGLLVVSQPKGWEGAIAVCARSLAGWYVSPEYRTFRCHEGRLTSRYLDMLIQTPWFQDQLAQLTRGQGARRERLRPEMLLAMDTKMPSMDAQATALDVIDRARTIRGKRAEIEKEFSELLPAMLNEVFGGEAGCSAA